MYIYTGFNFKNLFPNLFKHKVACNSSKGIFSLEVLLMLISQWLSLFVNVSLLTCVCFYGSCIYCTHTKINKIKDLNQRNYILFPKVHTNVNIQIILKI